MLAPTSNHTARTVPESVTWCPQAGGNDVTVIFKAQPGSRRWQHMAPNNAELAVRPEDAQRAERGGVAAPSGRTSPAERNYTVILGSHRNSCLKFEKDGELCCMVSVHFSSQACLPLLTNSHALPSTRSHAYHVPSLKTPVGPDCYWANITQCSLHGR